MITNFRSCETETEILHLSTSETPGLRYTNFDQALLALKTKTR